METKHTPGPWSVAECRYGFAVYASKSGDAVVQTEDVEGRYGAIDNEADARLIAAAPALLEALQQAFDFPPDFFDRPDDDLEQITVSGRHLRMVRAAIAKATGEPA